MPTKKYSVFACVLCTKIFSLGDKSKFSMITVSCGVIMMLHSLSAADGEAADVIQTCTVASALALLLYIVKEPEA